MGKPKDRVGHDVMAIYVAPAGIGRQGFKAWTSISDIDRQDGDDTGICDTPREAVEAVLDELERKLLLDSWQRWFEKIA